MAAAGPPVLTTLQPGGGTKLPERTAQNDTATLSLSTQLVIWGMVGFILLELIGIMCLLRYCCRARYLKKRKYKEREIILSDHPDPRFYQQQQQRIDHTLDSSSQSNLQMGGHEQQSVNSLRPILYNQSAHLADQNETIMVDDITSIYSINPLSVNTISRVKKTAARSNGQMQSLEIDYMNASDGTNIMTDYGERMRQELSAEDIYTLRFTSTMPVDSYLDHAPHHYQQQQQQYMYDGSLNRPAFEVVSHADVKPATPVHFEKVKEITSLSRTRLPTNNKQSIAGGDDQRVSSSSRRQLLPRLNFGHQENVMRVTGEPVEWQVANELRTADWDKLKNAANNDHVTPLSERLTREATQVVSTADTSAAAPHHNLTTIYQRQPKQLAGRSISPFTLVRSEISQTNRNSSSAERLRYYDDDDDDNVANEPLAVSTTGLGGIPYYKSNHQYHQHQQQQPIEARAMSRPPTTTATTGEESMYFRNYSREAEPPAADTVTKSTWRHFEPSNSNHNHNGLYDGEQS